MYIGLDQSAYTIPKINKLIYLGTIHKYSLDLLRLRLTVELQVYFALENPRPMQTTTKYSRQDQQQQEQ